MIVCFLSAFILMALDTASSIVFSTSFSILEQLFKVQVGHWFYIPFERGDTYLFCKGQMENLFEIHQLLNIADNSLFILTDNLKNTSRPLWGSDRHLG